MVHTINSQGTIGVVPTRPFRFMQFHRLRVPSTSLEVHGLCISKEGLVECFVFLSRVMYMYTLAAKMFGLTGQFT